MKKLLAILIVLVITVTALAGAYAEDSGFDYSIVENHPEIYDIDKSSGFTGIKSWRSNADLCFKHKYDNLNYYSSIRTMALALDISSKSPYGVVSTVLSYYSEKPQHFNGITIELNGVSYSITDLDRDSDINEVEGGYNQKLYIMYGSKNKFLYDALYSTAYKYFVTKNILKEEYEIPAVNVTLHGDENVEIQVPEFFWEDFFLVALVVKSDSRFFSIGDTPCTATAIENS